MIPNPNHSLNGRQIFLPLVFKKKENKKLSTNTKTPAEQPEPSKEHQTTTREGKEKGKGEAKAEPETTKKWHIGRKKLAQKRTKQKGSRKLQYKNTNPEKQL